MKRPQHSDVVKAFPAFVFPEKRMEGSREVVVSAEGITSL